MNGQADPGERPGGAPGSTSTPDAGWDSPPGVRRDAFLELAGAADAPRLTVVARADPMMTVLTSVLENFGPLSRRLPAAERAAARAAARHVPLSGLLNLLGGGRSCPDFLIDPGGALAFGEQVERLRETPSAVLDEELATWTEADAPAAARWQRDPERSLAGFCSALTAYRRDVVSRVHPHLEQRLRRETARLETALLEYGDEAVLRLLHPRLRLDAGRLRLLGGHVAGVRSWRTELLVLTPMVSAADTYHTNIGSADNPRVRTAFFGAAPPSLRPGRRPDGVPRDQGVDLLIGRPKAEILRSVRRRPGTTTDLADELGFTPSTVSYHLRTLHEAGAVARTRRGGSVHYRITDRGNRLLDA